MRTVWLWSGLVLVVVTIACGRLAFEPMPRTDSSVTPGDGNNGNDSVPAGDASGDGASTRKTCMSATECVTLRCGCGLCDPGYGECCMQATDCTSLRCGCGKCDPQPGDCCNNNVDCASLSCVGGICQ